MRFFQVERFLFHIPHLRPAVVYAHRFTHHATCWLPYHRWWAGRPDRRGLSRTVSSQGVSSRRRQ